MADFATALRGRLTGDIDVIAAVGTRVYWGIVPQSAALPYIRLQTISDPRDEHLKGYDGARVTRVQADCFAGSYAAARALAEDVIAAVAVPTATGGVQFGRVKAEGPRDLGEDTANGYVHRASLDLLVEHKLV
jgi:hypothetical protein